MNPGAPDGVYGPGMAAGAVGRGECRTRKGATQIGNADRELLDRLRQESNESIPGVPPKEIKTALRLARQHKATDVHVVETGPKTERVAIAATITKPSPGNSGRGMVRCGKRRGEYCPASQSNLRYRRMLMPTLRCSDHGAASRREEKAVQYFHACSLLLLSRSRAGHRWIELIEDVRCRSRRRGRCNRGQRRRTCRLRRDSRGGLGVCCRCRTGRGRRRFRAGSAKAQKQRQNQQSFHSAPPKG